MAGKDGVQRLDDLVLATVPAARPRRGETDRSKVAQREALRDDLVELANEIRQSRFDQKRVDEAQAVSQLKRKLTKFAVDGGHGTSVRLDNLIAKLKARPDQTQQLADILQFLDRLSFTAFSFSGASNAESSTSRTNGRSSISTPSSSSRATGRSPMLEVPDLRGARPSSSSSTLSDMSRTRTRTSSEVSSSSRRTARTSDTVMGPPPVPSQATARPSSATQPPPIPSSSSPVPQSPRPPEKPLRDALLDEDLPKRELLKKWRAKHGRSEVDEEALLRDVIYLLQGINGKYIGFEEARQLPSNDIIDGETPRDAETILHVRFYEENEAIIAQPTRHLVHRIAELGRLYKRAHDFSQQRSQQEGVGLIMQSLCHFISSELTDYYRLIAILEAQLNRKGSTKDDGNGLTLRRIAVWTEDVTLRMRLISTIIESCQDLHGGAIVSRIHTYTFNGDPFVRSFTAQLLEEVSKPFFHSLSRWIFEGELQDPFCEFFVELNTSIKAGRGVLDEFEGDNEAASLWQDQFVFKTDMLPSFLGEEFGRKIFSTGKSLNFIRFSCGDGDWVATRNNLSNSGRDLRYADLSGLERTIDTAYNIASTRLLDIFLDKFKLLDHLRALKDYLMLARGDFVDLLMESLGPSLSRPASSLFRHNLTASLETAVRGSNAQYDDPDIIGRLDARILEFVAGDTGWDTFTLEYKVDSPVNTVLDGQAMLLYQTVFNHLWKTKRVEIALTRSWERLFSASNILRRLKKSRKLLLSPGLQRQAHQALLLLSEMIHFVRQIQGFCQLEVIDYSWQDLKTFFAKRQGDLDELITSHRAYLNGLLGKVLLRSGRKDYLAQEVRANYDTMLAFANGIDDLAAAISAQLARVEMMDDGMGHRGSHHQERSQAPIESSAVAKIMTRIEDQASQFQERTQGIIARLEKHANLVVRDLGTRLNFNTFYANASERKKNTTMANTLVSSS